jgi:outer membrane receptor protein involved in Fe transport
MEEFMYLKKSLLFLVMVLLIGGICGYSYGQILTGSIRGTVKDESDAVLPGVTVELTSPALIGGSKIVVSNERGFFRFPDLPPGEYELSFSLEGFQTLKQAGIIVGVDRTVTVDVVLKVATVSETITVTAETPVVDVTKSGITTNWSTDMMESLPLLRYTFFDVVQSTPGVWSHGGNTDSSRSVAYGTGSESNTYLFDGVDTTAPDYGAGWSWLNPDVIQEVQVIGVGGKAEYGNFMGATVNIVTKSGGNNFRGGANIFYQNNSLAGDNSKDYLQELLDNGYISESDAQFPWHREKFYDVSFQLGGPIIKDRVWFFFAGWKQIDSSSAVGVDPRYYTEYDETQAFIKGTIQLNQNNKVNAFYNYEKFDLPDAYTPAYGSLDTVATERGTAPAASISLTSVLSDTTFAEIKYNYSGGEDFYESINYYKGPTYYNWNTDVTSGGPWWIYYFYPSRHGLNGTVSHFAEDFVAGDHDFKFGVQYSRGRADSRSGYSGGVVYATYTYYYNGTPYEFRYKYEMPPYSYGAASNQVALFVDDTWTVNDRLTLNVGLRYDHNTGWIPDQPGVAVDPTDYSWYDTDTIYPGKPDLVKWRVLAPRLGLAYKLTEDGKTLLRANVGRYYDQMTYGNWELPSPATPIWYMYEWTGSAWDLVTSWAPEFLTVDPNLKNPYADQFSFGIDRELLPNLGVSITYMEKWTHDQIGYMPAVGTWDDYYELITAIDPYTGSSIQAYNLIGDYPDIIISNPDMFYARFRMFSIIANKRMADNWQLSASFTYSKMWGLNPRGSSRQTYSENILWNSSSGKDPNAFLNIDGPLPADRPYSIKILGTYLFPYGIASSINLQIQSGSPYARMITVYDLNQGNKEVAAEKRGDNDHRFPTGYLLDLNIEKTFKIADKYSLTARFDVFNLLNRAQPYGMMDYSLIANQQWVYNGIWAPRRAGVTLKFRF